MKTTTQQTVVRANGCYLTDLDEQTLDAYLDACPAAAAAPAYGERVCNCGECEDCSYRLAFEVES